MSDLLDDVETAAKILRESGDPAAQRVAAGMEKWRASRTLTFENALGYPNGVRRTSRMKRRDNALRLAAAELGWSVTQTTEAVKKYQAFSWPDDKKRGRPTEGISGHLYDVMRNGGVPKWRQLYNILDGLL